MASKQNDKQVNVPDKLVQSGFFDSKHRFITLHGGRGSAKSWSFAIKLVLAAYKEKKLFLCCREIQNSIADSVHALLKSVIVQLGLEPFFTITDKAIRGKNGSEFIFKGLHRHIDSVKSIEGLDGAWIEEAQTVSRVSLDKLIPTVRKSGSQIFLSLNPEDENAPAYTDFVLEDRPDNLKIQMNYWDNPFFDEPLKSEMEYCKQHDYEAYLHIWEGNTLTISEACIFYGKYHVDSFETPDNIDFYYGADFGFSQDPSTLIRCFVQDDILYVDYEAYGHGVELDELPQMYDSVPGSRQHLIRADSARPDTISYLKRQDFNIKGVKKGKDSIIDGIQYIKKFKKVVIHSRCKHTIDEFKLYSFKVDKLSGEILNIIVDKHNHCIDAIRYALEDLRKFRNETLSTPELDRVGVLGW